MELIKIDPNYPPEFKKQVLFYDSVLRSFQLGEVDYIREDQNGKSIIYKPFQLVQMRDDRNFEKVLVTFQPTHYLNIDLDESAKTINNGNNQ